MPGTPHDCCSSSEDAIGFNLGRGEDLLWSESTPSCFYSRAFHEMASLCQSFVQLRRFILVDHVPDLF